MYTNDLVYEIENLLSQNQTPLPIKVLSYIDRVGHFSVALSNILQRIGYELNIEGPLDRSYGKTLALELLEIAALLTSILYKTVKDRPSTEDIPSFFRDSFLFSHTEPVYYYKDIIHIHGKVTAEDPKGTPILSVREFIEDYPTFLKRLTSDLLPELLKAEDYVLDERWSDLFMVTLDISETIAYLVTQANSFLFGAHEYSKTAFYFKKNIQAERLR